MSQNLKGNLLDFEKPLFELEQKLEEMRALRKEDSSADLKKSLSALVV